MSLKKGKSIKVTALVRGAADRLRLLRSKLVALWHKVTVRMRPLVKHANRKQRLVVMDGESYKERFSFQLSAINLFVGIGVGVIVLIILTVLLLAFTPLKGIIPGYANNEIVEQTYRNMAVLDSLETAMQGQERLLAAMTAAIKGEGVPDENSIEADTSQQKVQGGPDLHNRADSMLRREMEEPRVAETSTTKESEVQTNAVSQLYFPPIKGKVISTYNARAKQYGVDIAGGYNDIVKATGNGTVFFAGFTVESGYVMVIQHPGDAVSVYKHNSALLKKEGEMVRTGEPIAYLGNTGVRNSGPHLYFELWINGKPVNPLQYISF
ncbi:MAG: M23 family metallopeptidase [Bacteroidales bacterium]|nr:M23 family metallopeptidase [Bacteroidales bacterium]